MTRTGRPLEFDLDAATDAAMRLFWEYGYEATSVQMLLTAMDISSASLYGAFGSKERLFHRAVERYATSHGRVTDALADADLPPRQAVEQALRASARMQTDASHPLGCLLVLASIVGPRENEPVRSDLAGRRAGNRMNMLSCVRRGVLRGDLRPDTDVEALASALHVLLVGMSLEARDGVGADLLEATVTAAMALWDRSAAHPGEPGDQG